MPHLQNGNNHIFLKSSVISEASTAKGMKHWVSISQPVTSTGLGDGVQVFLHLAILAQNLLKWGMS